MAGLMDKIKWRIYYGNGFIFDGEPNKAPKRNVQVIIQTDVEIGREILIKYDFYLWVKDKWLGVDQFGLFDKLFDNNTQSLIALAGRMLTITEYKEIYKKALNDSDFPNKSAKRD